MNEPWPARACLLRSGIDSTLLGLGKKSVRDLTPEDVIMPESFTRGLAK